jgi:hypothetical protein
MANALLLQRIADGAVNAPDDSFSRSAMRGQQMRESQQGMQQRNALFQQQQEDRQRQMAQQRQEQQNAQAREALAGYYMTPPEQRGQYYQQVAPKFGLPADGDHAQIVGGVIQSNPGILGPELSSKILSKEFGAADAGLTVNERDAARYKNDPAFREYMNRPQRMQPYYNAGDQFVDPSGSRPPIDRKPPPDQDPDFKRRQAEAAAAGKGAGERAAEVEKRTASAGDALSVIAEIERILPAATGSGVGSAVDAVGRVVGVSPESAQAAAQLRVLAPQLLLKIPRMEGPQSDKDTQLYRDAAGNLSDSTRPIDERMAALQILKGLNEKYASVNKAPLPQNVESAPGLPPGWTVKQR